MKLLTVAIPCYNSEDYMEKSIRSALNGGEKVEVLIIDDGSTDGTREWVESLGEKITDKGVQYDWMGCPTDVEDKNHFVIETKGNPEKIRIEYITERSKEIHSTYNEIKIKYIFKDEEGKIVDEK